MGPQPVTPEVAEALRSVDYVLAAQKSEADGLLDVRREICAAHGVELVPVVDPERDRSDPKDYPRAVADWHEARVAAYFDVLSSRPGDVAFLVWGDPSLYDSTIRIVESLQERHRARVRRAPGHQRPAAVGRSSPDRAARGRSAAARHHRSAAAGGS